LRIVSPIHGLVAIAGDWGAILGSFALAGYLDHPFAYVIAAIVIGTRQHALSVLGHDGVHGLLHPVEQVNRWVTNLFCLWPLGATFDGYQPWHFSHHRNVGTPDDPELEVKSGPRHEIPLTGRGLVLLFAGNLVGLGIPDFFRTIRVLVPRDRIHLLGPASLWAVALLAVWTTGAFWVLVLWFGALLTVFWTVFHFRGLSEHTGTTDTLRFRPNLAWRLLVFPHNVWCHWEHHHWSFIPYRHLPAAGRLDTTVEVWSMPQLLSFFATHRGGSSKAATPIGSDTGGRAGTQRGVG
jgi:fatty acid desaturase